MSKNWAVQAVWKLKIFSGGPRWAWVRERIEEHLHIAPPLYPISKTPMSGRIRQLRRDSKGTRSWKNAGRRRTLQVFDDCHSLSAWKRFSLSSDVAGLGQDLEGHQRRQPSGPGSIDRLHLESSVPLVNLNYVKLDCRKTVMPRFAAFSSVFVC